MDSKPDTPRKTTACDSNRPESENAVPPRKKDQCPDCSPGDFICKCCGISVANDDWSEDDQMCGGCSSLLDKTEKKI